ncbi:hypothetical protein LSAT2_029382, partial [Lamellibrachia satsuma]
TTNVYTQLVYDDRLHAVGLRRPSTRSVQRRPSTRSWSTTAGQRTNVEQIEVHFRTADTRLSRIFHQPWNIARSKQHQQTAEWDVRWCHTDTPAIPVNARDVRAHAETAPSDALYIEPEATRIISSPAETTHEHRRSSRPGKTLHI